MTLDELRATIHGNRMVEIVSPDGSVRARGRIVHVRANGWMTISTGGGCHEEATIEQVRSADPNPITSEVE